MPFSQLVQFSDELEQVLHFESHAKQSSFFEKYLSAHSVHLFRSDESHVLHLAVHWTHCLLLKVNGLVHDKHSVDEGPEQVLHLLSHF